MNSVSLVGRITKDPQVEQLTNTNAKVLRFILAVERKVKDANGNKQADFISCVAFNNQADFIGNYVKKGNMIGINGRIQTGTYLNKQGVQTYTSDVVVESVENYTPKDNTQVNKQTNNVQTPQGYKAPQVYNKQQQQVDVPDTFICSEDDIPF